MKCPQCNYVSFDSMPRCKKCGFQFKPPRAHQEAIDVKSLIAEMHVQDRESANSGEFSGLDKTVSSIRKSLEEIDGRGAAEERETPGEQPLVVDTDELRFRLDDGCGDALQQFPDHNQINWEESVSLSNHDLTLPLEEDGFADAEPEQLFKRADDVSTGTGRFQRELREIEEELKEIDELHVPPRPAGALQASDVSAPGVLQHGGFWIRTVAYLIDTAVLYLLAIILSVVGIIALGVASSDLRELDEERIMGLMVPLYVFNTIITIFYFTYFHGSLGQTPGKMLCRLKVVRVNGEPLGYGRAFLRWAGYLPSSLVFCLGFLWAAFDRHKQAWHDKIAGTYVVKLTRP